MVADTVVTYNINTVRAPLVSAVIFDDADVVAAGQSEPIYIGGSTHLLLLVSLTDAVVGAGKIQFHIDVLEPDSATIMFTHDGVEKVAGKEIDVIAVDESSTTPLGDWVQVSWEGTLAAETHFPGTFVRLIAK